MTTDQRTDPLTALRLQIEAHTRDPKVRMFRLDTTLRLVDAALGELQRREGLLAEAYLQLLEHCGAARVLHPDVIGELGKLNTHADVIARRILEARQAPG